MENYLYQNFQSSPIFNDYMLYYKNALCILSSNLLIIKCSFYFSKENIHWSLEQLEKVMNNYVSSGYIEVIYDCMSFSFSIGYVLILCESFKMSMDI